MNLAPTVLDDDGNPVSPARRFGVSRADLKFGDHVFGGLIQDVEDGASISLPSLKPSSLYTFFKQIRAPAGFRATFRYPADFLDAFSFALAIQDHEMQEKIIHRIHAQVKKYHATGVEKVHEDLQKSLSDAIRWAFKEKSSLRGLFTMCLAYITTEVVKIKKQETPKLDLDQYFTIDATFRGSKWYAEYWQEFGQQLAELWQRNTNQEWDMVPVVCFGDFVSIE